MDSKNKRNKANVCSQHCLYSGFLKSKAYTYKPLQYRRTLVVDRSTRLCFFPLFPGSLMATGVVGVLDVTLANDVVFVFLAPAKNVEVISES